MQEILSHLNAILPISQKEIDEVTPFTKHVILEKDNFLLKAGERSKFLTFIVKGSLRSFHIRPNGTQVNIMLSAEGEFVGDLDSVVTSTPSTIYIQAIEKTEIFRISTDDLETLYENSVYWNTIGRKATEQVFVVTKRRLETLLYKTPKERYLEVLEHTPHLLNRFSLADISGYIGITPQSLSRIRAEL